MPSASTKPEKPASQEVVEPLKQLVTVVDKKIRNLEKKKGKLESYRVEYQKGALLNDDQKNAISRYDEVVHSLEFAKELQKQFYQIALEFTKNQKKQARQEQFERQTYQLLRTGEMLALQELLNNLGLENVREDFLVGNNGAVVLKEEELNQLDELYKLISPSREADDYEGNLKAAAEHLVFVLDGRKKSVIGTTYKDLKDLITKISECSYFDRSTIQEPVENGDEIEDRVEEVMEPEIIEQVYDIPSNEIDDDNLEVQSSLTTTTLGTTVETLEEAQVTLHVVSNPAPGLDNSYFSSTPYTQTTLAIHEVLPSVQDNFNFLQESQIDLESPHMDPAVVAALPMIPSSSQSIPYPQQTEPTSQQYSQQTYQGQNSPVTITPSNDLQPKPQRSTSAPQQQSGPPINQPLETQTFTNQNYVMAAHSLIGSSSSTAPTLSHPNHTPSSQSDTTPSAPLPIPLPNQQQLLQQQNAAVAAAVLASPKQFPMNVNAAAFHAVSLKQSPHESALSLQQMTGPQLQSQQQQLADLHGGYQHSQSQQTSGFPRSSSSCGNNNGRGIRGSRGSGRGGSSNGYSRGAPRGTYSNGRGQSRYSGNGMRGTQTRGGGTTRGGRGGFNKLQQGPQPQQASA